MMDPMIAEETTRRAAPGAQPSHGEIWAHWDDKDLVELAQQDWVAVSWELNLSWHK